MKLQLFVLPDGSIVGSYSDLIQSMLADPPRSVKRVTNIEWNDKARYWEAKTLTGKVIASSMTRENCLSLETAFVGRLLQQFFMCRRDDGHMWCPDCNNHLDALIETTCPHCGFEFPMIQTGFMWSDFQLEHLCR